jgi:hypothetical protein
LSVLRAGAKLIVRCFLLAILELLEEFGPLCKFPSAGDVDLRAKLLAELVRQLTFKVLDLLRIRFTALGRQADELGEELGVRLSLYP